MPPKKAQKRNRKAKYSCNSSRTRFCMFFCFTRPRYQVSVYRTIGPLVLLSIRSTKCLFFLDKVEFRDKKDYSDGLKNRKLGLGYSKNKKKQNLIGCTFIVCACPFSYNVEMKKMNIRREFVCFCFVKV